jgi:hypothetical protein
MIELGKRPIHGESVIAQTAQEALVVFHLESGEYYSLDPVGSRIWELCDGGNSVSQIVDNLCKEYDSPRHDVEVDVLQLLGELEKEGLIDAAAPKTLGTEQSRRSD